MLSFLVDIISYVEPTISGKLYIIRDLDRIINGIHRFQRQQPTSGGTVRSFRPANCCQLILPNRFLDGFPDTSQFAADKLTRYSSKSQQPSDSSRPGLRVLLPGDVHPTPGPPIKYQCWVCAFKVTNRVMNQVSKAPPFCTVVKFWMLGVLELEKSFDSCIAATLTLYRCKNSPNSVS